MAKKQIQSKRVSESLAIAALIVNLIIPGLGSIIANKNKEGTWQLILYIAGIILSIVLIGIPLVLASWIWALITSISLVKESQK